MGLGFHCLLRQRRPRDIEVGVVEPRSNRETQQPPLRASRLRSSFWFLQLQLQHHHLRPHGEDEEQWKFDGVVVENTPYTIVASCWSGYSKRDVTAIAWVSVFQVSFTFYVEGNPDCEMEFCPSIQSRKFAAHTLSELKS